MRKILRLYRIHDDNRVDMIWHHHIQRNINMWEMRAYITQTLFRNLPYLRQTHFAVLYFTEIMVMVVRVDGDKKRTATVIVPLRTPCGGAIYVQKFTI